MMLSLPGIFQGVWSQNSDFRYHREWELWSRGMPSVISIVFLTFPMLRLGHLTNNSLPRGAFPGESTPGRSLPLVFHERLA